MNYTWILVFCVLVGQLQAATKTIIRASNDDFSGILSEVENSYGGLYSQSVSTSLAKIIQKSARQQDYEMMQKIAEDFVKSQNKQQFTKQDIEAFRDSSLFENYARKWVLNMYNQLIDFYDITTDENFKIEMLNDPDNYGLTFDAYKIMTFKLDDQGNKRPKEEF